MVINIAFRSPARRLDCWYHAGKRLNLIRLSYERTRKTNEPSTEILPGDRLCIRNADLMGINHRVGCISNPSVNGLPKAADCHWRHGAFFGRVVVRTPVETNERSTERLAHQRK